MTPLRRKMLDALMLRGMADRTQESYIDAVSRLARHYRRSPERLRRRRCSSTCCTSCANAISRARASTSTAAPFAFLYGTVLGLDGDSFQIPLAPAPQRLPEILSREELHVVCVAVT